MNPRRRAKLFQVHNLRCQGLSLRQIARQISCAHTTVSQYLKDFARRREEIIETLAADQLIQSLQQLDPATLSCSTNTSAPPVNCVCSSTASTASPTASNAGTAAWSRTRSQTTRSSSPSSAPSWTSCAPTACPQSATPTSTPTPSPSTNSNASSPLTRCVSSSTTSPLLRSAPTTTPCQPAIPGNPTLH